MVVVNGKAVLFKSALDAVAKHYVQNYRRKGYQYPEVMGEALVKSDFAGAYCDPREHPGRGPSHAILHHPVVAARVWFAEQKVMGSFKLAKTAELYVWDGVGAKILTYTEMETARTMRFESAVKTNVNLRTSKIIGLATVVATSFATIIASPFSSATYSFEYGLYCGAIVGGLLTLSSILDHKSRFRNALTRSIVAEECLARSGK